MPRSWLDMEVNEADGIARISLITRSGTPAVEDVYAEVTSEIVQEGDQIGAAFANLISRLSDDAEPIPELYLNVGTPTSRIGTLRILHGPAADLPPTGEAGEIFVSDTGDFYTTDSTGAWIAQDSAGSVAAVQAALNAHITNYDNPHRVTRAQLGAAAATDLTNHITAPNPHSGSASTTALNNHISNQSNPHNVTKAQVGLGNVNNVAAYPLTGGALNGSMSATGNISATGFIQAGSQLRINTPAGGTPILALQQNGVQLGSIVANNDGAAMTLFHGRLISCYNTDNSGYIPIAASEFQTNSQTIHKSNIGTDAVDEHVEALKDAEIVTYTYEGTTESMGVLVEDINKVDDFFVENDESGEPTFVKLGSVTFANTRWLQKLQSEVDELKAEIAALKEGK